MDKTKLTPANENPWYVLMTLDGEQEGKWPDRVLAFKNRAVWNAWACQALDDDAAADLALQAGVDPAETRGWADMAAKVKDRHRAEMEKRNGANFKYPGFPEVSHTIDCSNIQFLNTLELSKCIFTQAANFNRATFTQEAYFLSATFTQEAYFLSATFTQVAYFNSVTFTHWAYFHFATFTQEANFNLATFTQKANFNLATFTQRANFDSATFTQRADFNSATFTQRADFNRATFTQGANFNSATFTQWASFNRATFSQGAYFDSATFTQEAYFDSATFTQEARFHSATFTKDADFSSATFNGPAYFVATIFGRRGGADVCVPNFTEAAFARLASFRGADFAHHFPRLEGAEFRETVLLTAKAAHWPAQGRALNRITLKNFPLPPQSPAAAKASAAKLRHLMAQQALPEEEHFFFRREMYAAARAEPFWRTGHIYLFEAVSDFGYSIARPANLLLALWLWVILIYTEGAGMGGLEALGYSFANMFKFFGLHRTYFDFEVIREWPAWVQWVSGAQTVLAFTLLFFLGLGLRTRFRLR